MQLDLYSLTGHGYERGWFTNCHCRYRAFKGGRNTKKSYVIAGYEALIKILTCPLRNVLFVRAVNKSNRLSTFSTMCKIIEIPDLSRPEISFRDYFKINYTEMIITYRPTGQVILFAGCDDPQKLQGIRTVKGYLTDVYIEEAFELDSWNDFRKIDGSIRGRLPKGYFFQITFLFNAWSQDHWLYEKLFKGRLEDNFYELMTHNYIDYKNDNELWSFGRGIYLHISTYKINEFRDFENYDAAMKELLEKAPEIFKVEALGMWGNASEATYLEFNESMIKMQQIINNMSYACYAIGIDTGLSDGEGKAKKNGRIRSATTMQMVAITSDYTKLCCIDEFFYSNEREIKKKTEPELMEDIVNTLIEWCKKYYLHPTLMKGTILVYVDCADIGFRQGLELVARYKGLTNVRFMPSTKIRIQTRVDFIRLIMAMGEFLISDNCKDLAREIKNSRKGDNGRPREDLDDHAINANEYAWAPIIGRLKRWSKYKEH